MTAFILSATIAFALYELLAFTEWPVNQSFISFCRVTLGLSEATTRTLRKVVVIMIVILVLLTVLTIHDFASPVSALARNQVNIIFGFVFGPLFAIWVNSVVVHSSGEDLTRGQIFGAIGLVILFAFGAVGSEGSGLIRLFVRNLTSLKLGVAELSFATREQGGRERLASTGIAGTSSTYVQGGSTGLQNLAYLDTIIERDQDYLKTAFAPKSQTVPDDDDLRRSAQFAKSTITPPLKCLFAWFEQTADSGPVEKYLSVYSDTFRRLDALNAGANAAVGSLDPLARERGLNEVSSDFVRNGLHMALDIFRSTGAASVLPPCGEWFEIYCPSREKPPTTDQEGYINGCLQEALDQFIDKAEAPKTGKVLERITYLADNLDEMIEPRRSRSPGGLEVLPYFAVARASLMTQLGQHEAAAAILDDWLSARRGENERPQRQAAYQVFPALQRKDDWFALRVRSMLVVYVEEWLADNKAKVATVVQTEHLRNLQATIDGIRARLRKADFFEKLSDACRTKCEPVFKRPTICESDEPLARLKLWQRLYSSYVTMEYTYIHRTIEHPDYAKLAEAVNDEARKLANFDLSCGTDQPPAKVLYAQSLLAFAENAVAYSRLRAKIDDQATHQKRLNEAERAAKFGLQIVDDTAREDQERSGKPYLARIAPSFAVGVQEQLKLQIAKIDKARTDLAE